MKKHIGYQFSPAVDNDALFYRNNTTVIRCPHCNEILNKDEADISGIDPETTSECSGSIDGVLVVNTRFREFYENHDFIGLRFIPLFPGYFAIRATQIVFFDYKRRGTMFSDLCNYCGRYKSIVGATPIYLCPGTTIPPNGFVRTDLEFASGDEKHPLILFGTSVVIPLAQARFSGLDYLRPVKE